MDTIYAYHALNSYAVFKFMLCNGCKTVHICVWKFIGCTNAIFDFSICLAAADFSLAVVFGFLHDYCSKYNIAELSQCKIMDISKSLANNFTYIFTILYAAFILKSIREGWEKAFNDTSVIFIKFPLWALIVMMFAILLLQLYDKLFRKE